MRSANRHGPYVLSTRCLAVAQYHFYTTGSYLRIQAETLTSLRDMTVESKSTHCAPLVLRTIITDSVLPGILQSRNKQTC